MIRSSGFEKSLWMISFLREFRNKIIGKNEKWEEFLGVKEKEDVEGNVETSRTIQGRDCLVVLDSFDVCYFYF